MFGKDILTKIRQEPTGLNINMNFECIMLRKVESLGEVGSGILAKMEGAETTDIDEQNQILMMLLKANCEVSKL